MVRAARLLVVSDPRITPGDMEMPLRLLRQLDLSPGTPVRLEIGQRSVEARVQASRRTSDIDERWPRTGIHPSTLRQLAVPDDRLRAHIKVSDGRVRIGPFVGVFALRSPRGAGFGELERYFRYLSAYGRPLGVPTYIFSARDIDWQRRCVRAYRWMRRPGGTGWVRSVLPMPDVVYDRLATRRAERRAIIRSTKERLRSLSGSIYFNPGFFNKWQMHSRLSAEPYIAPYLPATERVDTVENVRRFLQRYPTVYFKPGDGSLGLGIIVVRRTGRGYESLLSTRSGTIRRSHSSFAGLTARLARAISRGNYIMQQGIPLARWRGRRFDIRILMQKDNGGRWQRTKAFARVAPPGGVTSNISGGGEGKNLNRVLRGAFGRAATRLRHRIDDVCAALTPRIEACIGGTLGEIGLDLAIDRRGRLWIIEVNSKPFLQMTPGSGSRREISLSALRPLRWSRHAAGFEPTSGAGWSRFTSGTERDGSEQDHPAADETSGDATAATGGHSDTCSR